MNNWKDIKDAPKDGKEVLLFDGKKIVLGWFGEDWHMLSKGEWLYGTGDDFSTGYYFNPIKPTHFMELPEPPTPIYEQICTKQKRSKEAGEALVTNKN